MFEYSGASEKKAAFILTGQLGEKRRCGVNRRSRIKGGREDGAYTMLSGYANGQEGILSPMICIAGDARKKLQPFHEEIATRGENNLKMSDHVSAERLAQVLRRQPKDTRQLIKRCGRRAGKKYL